MLSDRGILYGATFEFRSVEDPREGDDQVGLQDHVHVAGKTILDSIHGVRLCAYDVLIARVELNAERVRVVADDGGGVLPRLPAGAPAIPLLLLTALTLPPHRSPNSVPWPSTTRSTSIPNPLSTILVLRTLTLRLMARTTWHAA